MFQVLTRHTAQSKGARRNLFSLDFGHLSRVSGCQVAFPFLSADRCLSRGAVTFQGQCKEVFYNTLAASRLTLPLRGLIRTNPRKSLLRGSTWRSADGIARAAWRLGVRGGCPESGEDEFCRAPLDQVIHPWNKSSLVVCFKFLSVLFDFSLSPFCSLKLHSFWFLEHWIKKCSIS